MFDLRKMPDAVTAPEWEARGNKWDPRLHFTGAVSEDADIDRINALLREHGANVAAYWLYPPLPGAYSLELQFKDDASSREARAAWYEEEETEEEAEAEDLSDHVPQSKRVSLSAEFVEVFVYLRGTGKKFTRLLTDRELILEMNFAIEHLEEQYPVGAILSKECIEAIVGHMPDANADDEDGVAERAILQSVLWLAANDPDEGDNILFWIEEERVIHLGYVLEEIEGGGYSYTLEFLFDEPHPSIVHM